MTFAFCTSSIPISSHCFWPCDRAPASRPASLVRPMVSSAEATDSGTPRRARSSDSGERPAPAAMSRFCSTVSSVNTLAVWNVRPTPSRAIWCGFLPSRSLSA